MIPKCILTVFYTAVIAVADLLLACFGPKGRLPYRNSADVDEKTDEELLDQCISVPRDEWDASSCPHRLTPDVLVKVVHGFTAGWPSEALAQDLVKNHTNIPVPPIRRVVKVDSSQSIIVMDFIPGITLAVAWPTMGFWQKIRIAFTLRSYVHQLRTGQLWLIDFATAGFYPRWFEYVNMVIDARCEGGPEYDSMWWAIIPFVADPYFRIYDWVSRVSPECL
ncbi:hypothetical protein IW261DRAFT_1487662 [Armillaria novae-zelandiae]|uniref:Protein kinase domain-containing protein n=1 Tax=Armillaria novae-zelandiae TaxID=153914 RepID=A0AA39P4K2_9AGAR|nr:hypothetical protein IW261DRAFT_1487662 [Armillaria novae-zelandiae]